MRHDLAAHDHIQWKIGLDCLYPIKKAKWSSSIHHTTMKDDLTSRNEYEGIYKGFCQFSRIITDLKRRGSKRIFPRLFRGEMIFIVWHAYLSASELAPTCQHLPHEKLQWVSHLSS